MNLKELKEMINIMNANSLSELEIEEEGLRIKLKKDVSGISVDSSLLKQLENSKIPAASIEKTSVTEQKTSHLIEITSPMVGTFYASPSPDASAFVDIGSNVKVDDVVCIIEAMKLMNEVKSEVKGKIVEILVQNGEAVEFGQVLFRLEPS